MASPEMKETAINRLKRIEGQMRGIQRLLENDSHCTEVMNQLFAGTAQEIIQEMAKILNRHIK